MLPTVLFTWYLSILQTRMSSNLVLRYSSCLEVSLNVPRVKIGNAHQETGTRERPQLPEAEQRLQDIGACMHVHILQYHALVDTSCSDYDTVHFTHQLQCVGTTNRAGMIGYGDELEIFILMLIRNFKAVVAALGRRTLIRLYLTHGMRERTGTPAVGNSRQELYSTFSLESFSYSKRSVMMIRLSRRFGHLN